jgi:hypothetical protein
MGVSRFEVFFKTYPEDEWSKSFRNVGIHLQNCKDITIVCENEIGSDGYMEESNTLMNFTVCRPLYSYSN